jgi:hypothetical protein
MPPAAMTGIFTASTTCGSRLIVPVSDSSALFRNEGRCPPASEPVATTMSTPAASFARASSAVVAAPTVTMFRRRHARRISGAGMPKTKLSTGGRISSTTSTCCSNLSSVAWGNSGKGIFSSSQTGFRKSVCARKHLCISAASISSRSETHRLMANGFSVWVRISVMIFRISAAGSACAPNDPSPPQFATVAASRTVEKFPPNGPCTMGIAMPNRRAAGVSVHMGFNESRMEAVMNDYFAIR